MFSYVINPCTHINYRTNPVCSVLTKNRQVNNLQFNDCSDQLSFGQKNDLECRAINLAKFYNEGKGLSRIWDKAFKDNSIIFEGADRNFLQVSHGLYRGPQPGEKGIQKLADKGIKVIINLKQDSEKRVKKYKNMAEKCGLDPEDYHNLPFNHFDKPDKDNNKKIKEIFKIIEDAEEANKPVYIHCQHGEDRTGMIIAIYRVIKQEMPIEDAVKEWQDLGYRNINYPGLREIFNEAIKETKNEEKSDK